MWDAVAYTSSGLTLVAFLAAAVAWAYKQKVARDAKLIRTAPANDRASLVLSNLKFFHVDASQLTKNQRYDLITHQLRARQNRLAVSAMVMAVVALFGATVSIFAVSRRNLPNIPVDILTGTAVVASVIAIAASVAFQLMQYRKLRSEVRQIENAKITIDTDVVDATKTPEETNTSLADVKKSLTIHLEIDKDSFSDQSVEEAKESIARALQALLDDLQVSAGPTQHDVRGE